jgi:hypothetical protein
MPDTPTSVRVDHEDLSFVLDELDRADVTASYQLTNAGDTTEADDVAFAYVRGERPDAETFTPVSIQADGAVLPFRETTDEHVDRSWAILVGREPQVHIGLLLFHLDFRPGQTRVVTVRYVHHADTDLRTHVNATFRFDYLLSPAKRWAAFGPLKISVLLPANAWFASSLPFERNANAYTAVFSGLPEGELQFETMSREGLWFGLSRPDDYAAILASAVVLAAVGVGASLGRRWVAGGAWQRRLLPLAAGLATMCALAVVVLLHAAFPQRALGVGYGAALMYPLMLVLAMTVGAASAALAKRFRRVPSGARA